MQDGAGSDEMRSSPSRKAGAPRLLIVGGGPFQMDIIATTRRLGVEVVVVDRDADAPGMKLADHPFAIDTTDVGAVVALAERLAVDGVTTAASDAALAAVSAVVEARGLLGLGQAPLRDCRDKLRTYQVMAAAGLPAPETVLVHDVAEAEAAARALGGYPMVVKPRSCAGGRGIAFVHEAAELPAALARAGAYSIPGLKGVLVQQYVGGLSVGVEAFFWHGQVAEAFVLNDQYRPGFVSPIGHSLPSHLDRSTQAAVVADAARFAAAIGIEHGPVNFDLRRIGHRTVLIEINPRLGGNSITELVRCCYGADLSEATILAALGRSPTAALAKSQEQPVACRLFAVRSRETLHVPPDLFARLRNAPEVVSLSLMASNGVLAALAVDEWSLLGSCLVRSNDAAAAEQAASAIAGSIEGALCGELRHGHG